ncbi:MAG: hypothetical protein V3V20_04575 [Algisphaera sp.]
MPPSTPDTHPAAAPAEPERPVFDDPQVGRVGKLVQRIERKVSRLSTKNNFWHRSIARIFLPLAYRSGITFRKQALSKDGEFECVVPFSRFNKNWYNAMAGAALLANSEVAGGMYIFKRCGSDYTVVCKHLEYKFRRPCVGPAIYRVIPQENIEPLVATGDEFNITVNMTILQAVVKKDEKERKVGESIATFHVTPKAMFRARKAKQAARAAEKAARRR